MTLQLQAAEGRPGRLCNTSAKGSRATPAPIGQPGLQHKHSGRRDAASGPGRDPLLPSWLAVHLSHTQPAPSAPTACSALTLGFSTLPLPGLPQLRSASFSLLHCLDSPGLPAQGGPSRDPVSLLPSGNTNMRFRVGKAQWAGAGHRHRGQRRLRPLLTPHRGSSRGPLGDKARPGLGEGWEGSHTRPRLPRPPFKC